MGLAANSQWTDLELELRDRVWEGQLSQSEADQIVQYIIASGLPVSPEEVLAIPGLGWETQNWLMSLPAWRVLCTGLSYGELSKKTGLRLESRFSGSPHLDPVHSMFFPSGIRLKNPGKWALRWEPSEKDPVASAWSGSLLGRLRKQGVQFVAGHHRVGWGNRLLISESNAFVSIEDPVFALPVRYAFAPAWGMSPENRMGAGLAWSANRAHATLSLHRTQNPSPTLRPAGCFALHRGQMECGVIWVQTKSRFQGSVFASGTYAAKNIQWSMEATANARQPKADVSWQRIHNQHWEGFGHWTYSYEEREWSLKLGGQWTADRNRFLVRWSLQTQSFLKQSAKFNVQWKASSAQRFVFDWKWNQDATNTIDEFNEHRVSLRLYSKGPSWQTQWRVEHSLASKSVGLGAAWMGEWKVTSKASVRWGVAHWNMPDGRRGYFTEPSFDGVSFRTMVGEGYRFVLGMEKSFPSKITFESFLSGSSNPQADPMNENLSTLIYAQTQLSARIRLQL